MEVEAHLASGVHDRIWEFVGMRNKTEFKGMTYRSVYGTAESVAPIPIPNTHKQPSKNWKDFIKLLCHKGLGSHGSNESVAWEGRM